MGKKRTLRVCQNCGKSFYGVGDYHYCPECARQKKLDTVVKIRTCQDCNVEFYGGPRAKRCPECAYKERLEASRRNKKRGTVRPIGSIDHCAVCGAEYTVNSGRQKYCSDACQRIGVLAWQREHKKNYSKNSEQYEKRKKRRADTLKVCIYCLRTFQSNRPTNLCSDYCKIEQGKINRCKADIKRGYNRNLQKYIDQREEYRKKVKEEKSTE